MEITRPEFVPDPAADRETMASIQRDIATAAAFRDDLDVTPGDVALHEPVSLDRDEEIHDLDESAPLVVGVDQAFMDGYAVSAVVGIQAGAVVLTSTGITPLEIPYIPGLLAFREGPPIIEALADLPRDPDVLFVDGSGRIHYRQAGLATHIGVLFDVPTVGVAKNLLCGEPDRSLDTPLPQESTIPIRVDDAVEAPPGTLLGYAFQSRQFANTERRHVNPLYVSPGHRVSADTAVALTGAVCAGYKLPEPIRLADSLAADSKD
jgi:deoxyribonuclease V